MSETQLREAAAWSRRWLFESALPLWWQAGADHAGGGFHEKLDLQGRPVGTPTRVRVQARQLYVYAEAGRLGWQGPWRTAMEHALDFMLREYARGDGLFRSNRGGSDSDLDIYDQAFVLFALSQAYAADGRPAELLRLARMLMERLDTLLAHPLGGYEEANPRRLPLRSNPHMHLLEALLAWVELGVDLPFRERALQIVALGSQRLIDPATGAVGEFFDSDWRFAAGAEGEVREPGHQFEWAFLMDQSQRLLGSDTSAQGRALEHFGSRHGIDAQRGVAIAAVDATGHPVDRRARLWAQTERLRTSLLMESSPGASSLAAFATLQRFLSTPVNGLWWEWMAADGEFVREPSPATSLYHIMTALSDLCRRHP
ncbi:MAG TPA: AGE family epimerase/isomerase [Solimonas sp.]